MDEKKFNLWIKQILNTEQEEISCSECFDLVSDFVDAELEGREMGDIHKKVAQHIYQCAVCRQEYELLRGIVEANDIP
jgi:hypothetical protein